MTHDETAAAPMLRRFSVLRDYTIGARDGDIGSVDDVYLDDLSWTVRYLVVDTGSWLSGRKVLLCPAVLEAVDPDGRRVRTHLTRDQVKHSPSIDADKPVSRQHETTLASYYGYAPYWDGPYRWGPYAYPALGVLAPVPAMPRDREAEELAAREHESQDEHLRSARAVTGYGIRATDGELGHVEDFVIDEREWAIRYLIVDPRSWWPGAHVLIAVDWLRRISWEEGTVAVDLTRDAVRHAPRYDPSTTFGRDDERRLHAHHGRPGYWDRGPDRWRQDRPAA